MVICKIPVTFSVLPMGEDLLGMGVGQRSSRYGGGAKIFGKTFHMWRSNFWASDLQFLVFIFSCSGRPTGGHPRAVSRGQRQQLRWLAWIHVFDEKWFNSDFSLGVITLAGTSRPFPRTRSLRRAKAQFLFVCLFVCVVCFLPRNLILPNQKLDGSRPEQIYLA